MWTESKAKAMTSVHTVRVSLYQKCLNLSRKHGTRLSTSILHSSLTSALQTKHPVDTDQAPKSGIYYDSLRT